MQEALQSLEAIQQKINLVQQKIESQKKEISDLKAENEKLLEQTMQLEEEKNKQTVVVTDLEAQIQVMKLAKQLSDEDDVKKTELKKMIGNMIKEVDKCLAVVNAN